MYTEEHWRTGNLGAVVDIGAARTSLHTIAEQEHAKLIFGHDLGQSESLSTVEASGVVLHGPHR